MDRAALIAALDAGLLAPERAVVEMEPAAYGEPAPEIAARPGDRDPDDRAMAAAA